MRGRTPSDDDTAKRAPPAPASREAASVDVGGSETRSDDAVEDHHTTKLSDTSPASGSTSSLDSMVASTQSLEDLGVNHPANPACSNADRPQQQQQQERYGHAYKSSAQTAQDKRSRLSSVINNLRKKVPDGTGREGADSPRKEEDDRNSVERNLETLEKYVMTVLNGVIKDDDEEDKGKNAEKTEESERLRKDVDEEEEDPTSTPLKSEPSSEGDIEAAVVPQLEDPSTVESAVESVSSEITDCSNVEGTTEEENVEDSEVKINQESNLKESSPRIMEEERLDIEEKEVSEDDRDVLREKKENRTLGTIIMDRLSEHQVEERANVDDGRGENRRDEQQVSENMEARTICVELLDDLLNDIYRTIDENQKKALNDIYRTIDENQKKAEECEEKVKGVVVDGIESRAEDTKDTSVRELPTTSLHCSLPLDKVASVLQNCQTVESTISRLSSGSPSSPPSTQKSKSSTPPIRLLCLYCDRKFPSVSRRQRHTERVHQFGGGRKSERNFRKSTQNCQYCSDNCANTLEALFQHMVATHGDKYHACVQCSTRYPTREALMGHIGEAHNGSVERTSQIQLENIKEGMPCKEFCIQKNSAFREKTDAFAVRRSEESQSEANAQSSDSRQSDSDTSRTKLIATGDCIDNPASPDFDSTFYSNVSCNIRENLLHHLDGKLQTISGASSPCTPPVAASSTTTTTTTELKSQQQQQQLQQSYYEHNANQIQFPIDISLTAATPVYSKDYSGEEYENSSEFARKAGKTSSGSRPRRVSFEKYNFPRKYDGKEMWTCSIKDLSKFDISTQLSFLKKRQSIKEQSIKERLTINRLYQIPTTLLPDQEETESSFKMTADDDQDDANKACDIDTPHDVVRCDLDKLPSSEVKDTAELSLIKSSVSMEFSAEFADFMKLRRREPSDSNVAAEKKIVYAELSGEWSRERIHICVACGFKHEMLKDMEDHKATMHPRTLCMHYELTGDQRKHYKHLYLPGRNAPTDEARDAAPTEMVCTKCQKNCPNVAELHRHMLECGGDYAWLLGLTNGGKKKCKWRPFGSRSRRRRQRGMKRNIQNSQTQPRIIHAERPKEKQTPTGPRVRPSDRESIQKMLANLPPKRATRKVLQDNALRSQGKLRNVQSRTRPRDNSSVSRISRNKAALRNKLLKNAKSIQRKRCRNDNITAVIESIVNKCHEARGDVGDQIVESGTEGKKDAKEISESLSKAAGKTLDEKTVRPKAVGRPRVLGKKRNVKTKTGLIGKSQLQSKGGSKQLAILKAKSAKLKNNVPASDANDEEASSSKNTPKNTKVITSSDKKLIFEVKSKNKAMLKKKRSVDPVASLNASLKAKSQLRTQDGKFARNPNKDSSAKSTAETKTDGRKQRAAKPNEVKLKSKTMQKSKKPDVNPPRKITRLSSDSDKMPTLEPVAQIVSPNEEYIDKSTNDLPILSPVTPQDQKTSRITAKCNLKEKESNIEAAANIEAAPETRNDSKTRTEKETAKLPREVKKLLREAGSFAFNSKLMSDDADSPKRSSLRQSKSLDMNCTEFDNEINNSTSVRKKRKISMETIRKSARRNVEMKTDDKEMARNDAETKTEKDSVKLSHEVKKLLREAGSMAFKPELTAVDADSKRSSLRQSVPRSKALQMSDKQELDDELINLKGAYKKEKTDDKEVRSDSKTRTEKDSAKLPREVKKLLRETDSLGFNFELTSDDADSKRSSLRQSARKTFQVSYNDTDDEINNSMSVSKKRKIETIIKSARKNVEKKTDDQETKNEAKTRTEKDSVKLSHELKKLLREAGSFAFNSKLTSDDTDSKRSSLRQSVPRSRALQVSDKNPQELDDESINLKSASKKEKIDDKEARSNSKTRTEEDSAKEWLMKEACSAAPKFTSNDKVTKTSEKDSTDDTTVNVTQNEKSQQSKRADAKAKENAIESSDVEDKIDDKHTKGSLIDAKSEREKTDDKETRSNSKTKTEKDSAKVPFEVKWLMRWVMNETESDSLRKNDNPPGKRRSRHKSVDEVKDANKYAKTEQSESENIVMNEKETERELEEAIEKNDENENDGKSDDRSEAVIVNLNLNHLQSETSNLSVDSGKENSVETSVNVHSKVKVGRPKKAWGARRERSSRERSLNNVIGILTEGINIPAEAQQSVQVLTVHTSLDNPDRVARNGSAQQPSGGDGNVIAADSTFSELSVVAKSEQEPVKNEVVTATNATDSRHADGEDSRSCPNKAQDENTFIAQKIDVSSKVATAKTHSPANDIILDLSRRKTKGKGSFLEKIVSKIAKQKDALLEGEVGSLLDNAADELTSILDEVGPTLIDTAESLGEASHASKNDSDKNVTSTSADEKPPAVANPEIRPLGDDKVNVENVVSERTTDLLEIQDNSEETLATKTEMQSESQTKTNYVLDPEMKNDDVVERQTSDEISDSVEKLEVESSENKPTTNDAIISVENSNKTNSSTEVSSSPVTVQKTNSKKFKSKKTVAKSKRKSGKRLLENASWPRKSKRRSEEVVEEECAEKNATQKEPDTTEFIPESETSNVGDEFVGKNNGNVETLNADTEVEKVERSEISKKNLELSDLETNLAEDDDRSKKESANFPNTAREDAKESTTSLEESADKLTSKENAVVTDVQPRESLDIDSSASFSETSVKSGKGKKKDQTDTRKSPSRRTSKKKSHSSVNLPVDTATDVFQASAKSTDETEEVLFLSSAENKESSEPSGEQLLARTTSIDTDVSLEKQATSAKHEKSTNDSNNPVNLALPKATKKRGAKKKSLADEHLELPEDDVTEIASKLNDESKIADSNERVFTGSEQFKVPEVARKRGPKKKSLPEDGRWNGGSVPEESQASEEPAEMNATPSSMDNAEEQGKTERRATKEESSTKRLERSNSSGSIGLISSAVKTRSKKKTPLSSEDLTDSHVQNQSAESADDLSESSCASEFSYFRRKRFAKKKRKEEEERVAGIDSSIADLESKNEADKAKSLLDEHLDLSDTEDIEVPADIKALENTKALEDIEREFELAEESSDLQNEGVSESTTADDSTNKANSEQDITLEQPASSNYNSPDDPVAPKKRAAGNFAVAHTKTGKILIVEKKKKLTKEAARFFCDVCATSFTRKSSLKKHTLSQSHLSQMARSDKDKIDRSASENTTEIDEEWKADEAANDQQASSVAEDDVAESHEVSHKSLETNENCVSYQHNAESTSSLMDLGAMRQEMLEDKLLDEEICKITENMSHDEYVLTDHLTPEPSESSSTPIKPVQKKQEEIERGKNGEKKQSKSKSKKKNLAEEHLLLDSPDFEKSKTDSDDTMTISSSLCESTLTKGTKEAEDVPDEARTDSAETKNRAEEETKSSICGDIDTKAEQLVESAKTTRRALRKHKTDNDGKEENQAATETNRFSLRPRRNKYIQHYEEFDVEADVYFMGTLMDMDSDEIESNYDVQKSQNKAEEEPSKNTSEEKSHTAAESKSSQDAEGVARSRATASDTKKKKRGRPRLKDRSVSNSIRAESEGHDGNDVVTTGSFDESKLENQKVNVDANTQPLKRSRGRPRKNPIQATNSFAVQADNSDASELEKISRDEVSERPDQVESRSETNAEEMINSSTPNPESLSAAQDCIAESSLPEMKKDSEEERCVEVDVSEDQPTQEEESTNVTTTESTVARDCTILDINVSEKDNDDASILGRSTHDNDAECNLENKVNASVPPSSTTESPIELPSQTMEKVPLTINDLNSIESRTIKVENSESEKLVDVSETLEEKLTKSEEEALEASQEDPKVSSESEGSENDALIADDKIIPVGNSHEPPPQQTTDADDNVIHEEKITQLESSNKKSKSSVNKERGTENRRKSKGSKGSRRKRITASKIAELSSDSENEDDRIESASSNKSKIVKSVFGRVFGGEKADKVKEVLNDWVSRSEDDSDVSSLRGLAKIAESEHKKEHKKRHSEKDVERSPRKKGNRSGGGEVKSKNRKKRERDHDSASENHVDSPVSSKSRGSKRKCRESKIRADKRILKFFDYESLIASDEVEDIKNNQFDDDHLNDKIEKSEKYHEEEWNEEQTMNRKDRNLSVENWENLQVGEDELDKSKNNSNRAKRQDIKDARNEYSSSQFDVFKYRRRKCKTRAGERIWRTLGHETPLSCPSDNEDFDETYDISKKKENEFFKYADVSCTNNSKQMDNNDIWENSSLENQEHARENSKRGKSRKDASGRKREDFSPNRISQTKTDEGISRDSDNEPPIFTRDKKTKSESRNRARNPIAIKDGMYESLAYDDLVVSKHVDVYRANLLSNVDHTPTSSKKSKKGINNEDWKCSARSLEFNRKDLADNNQLIEKDIRQKDEESSRSCSSLAGEEPMMKDHVADLDGSSQKIRGSDDDNDDDEDEDEESDLVRRRLSPFYARETPDSSIESDFNNEEEDDEQEKKRMAHEDNSKKISPSEFSGEKIVIRSPSLGHRSDVVTIAPTDAIEDNALDVPREIESTTEPRQGKILNFDEELFVECCSRLKATSENELRGAKKIKLDHTESYHRRDDQPQAFRVNRDRWRDVESQNTLGSLLESVNHLLGEEMYNSHDRSYRTRGSERSSRSASPDASRVDNLGYEDSLDVAFEHNNKLRDKIQQRMRESENLIASTFGQKTNDDDDGQNQPDDDDKQDNVKKSSSMHEHEQLSASAASNREQGSSSGLKSKMNSTLGLIKLDKALTNLLHSNGKHDHNGSAPMKLLAELACARAPTSTLPEDTASSGNKNHQSVKISVAAAVAVAAAAAVAAATKDTPDSPKRPTKDSTVTPKHSPTKKARNPIRELFERKKEMNDRKDQERSKAVELSTQKQRKPKKSKKQQQLEFPLIRRSEHSGGMMEKKKRRDSLERKTDSERVIIKDVYEFDEEESQTAPALGSVLSYRCQIDKNYETANWSRMKNSENFDIALKNGKVDYAADTKLDAVIDRKFQELEKFAPKTKGALKSFQSEEQQQRQGLVIGPMDEFVEKKQQRLKRSTEQSAKQSAKLKKRGKSPKKRARNAWYENDSSDEFRTAAKTEDVGVGISKSQRACSKGKQNLFAELSTSSESEYERDDVDYDIASEQRPKKRTKKSLDVSINGTDQRVVDKSEFDNEDHVADDWRVQLQEDSMKKDDAAKSESEMSDHSLVIDERKATDEMKNSDDDADNQYERSFELDDLYREDSSDTETEVEENEDPSTEKSKDGIEELDKSAQEETTPTIAKDDYTPENELIPLEEALDLLDQHEGIGSKNARAEVQKNNIANGLAEAANKISNDGIVNEESKRLSPEMQDEKEELDDDIPALPEKLSSNEKPQKESDNNLPLHVFLSRKVQESKKRKQQQLDKLREEKERLLLDFQSTRRQRKCAIGKQGLLAEISSSDEEPYVKDNSRRGGDHDKPRKKRESKEKKKERYLEKKHDQMIAKEQKAIEEEILREVGKRKEMQCVEDVAPNSDAVETNIASEQTMQKKKHQTKEKQKKYDDENTEENAENIDHSSFDVSEDNCKSEQAYPLTENTMENNSSYLLSPSKRKKLSKSSARSRKISKSENEKTPRKKSKESIAERPKKSTMNNKDSKERRSSNGKRDSDDEELKTTKSWNKVEEGVGVAIGRRKRTAAMQLYYWSSSSDEEEVPEPTPAPEEEDDRQEQHGWIVGDSHKRMITMLAMEKQLKEKRRKSEDEFESGKSKSKKHRNSTS